VPPTSSHRPIPWLTKSQLFMTVVMMCFQSSIGSWTMSLITNCVPKEGSRKRSSPRSPSAWGRRPYTDDDSRRPLLTILGGTLVHNWKYPGQPFRRKRIWSSSFTKHAPRKSRTLSSPCALLINPRRHRRQKLMQSQAKVDSATVRNLSSKIRVSVQYDVTKACRSIQKRTISRLRKDRILEGLKLC
jgi:hypothetical protein